MNRIVLALLVVLVMIPGYGSPESAVAQDQLGTGDALVCGHFTDLSHAQAVFVAAGGLQGNDEYGLDNERPEGDLRACNGAVLATRDPLATCGNFREQEHAQALLEAAGPNAYDLNVVDGRACPESSTVVPTPSTPPPSSASGCAGIMAETSHAIACSGGGGTGSADTFPDDDPVFVSRTRGGSGIEADIADVASGISSTPLTQPATGTFTQQSSDSTSRLVENEQTARDKARAKKKRKAMRARIRQAERARLRELKQQNDIRSQGSGR